MGGHFWSGTSFGGPKWGYPPKKFKFFFLKSFVSVSVSVSGSIGRDNNCKIVDGVCSNSCDIKNISVTGKKWVKNKRTMLHGWKSVKVTKPICVKGSSRANLDNRAKSESERNGI